MTQIKMTRLAYVQQCLRSVCDVFTEFSAIANAHTVDFVVSDMWNMHLSCYVQDCLMNLSTSDLQKLPNGLYFRDKLKYTEAHLSTEGQCPEFLDYLSKMSNNSLSALSVTSSISDLVRDLPLKFVDRKVSVSGFMFEKKVHEVNELAQIISSLAKSFSVHQVVDVGSGLGYLTNMLHVSYGLNVTGVECCGMTNHNAELRKERQRKHWKNHLVRDAECQRFGETVKRGRHWSKRVARLRKAGVPVDGTGVLPPDYDINNAEVDNLDEMNRVTLEKVLKISECAREAVEISDEVRTEGLGRGETEACYHTITKQITNETRFSDIIPNSDSRDVLLCGLHTCGSLASNIIHMFTGDERLKVLCNVGCCYHSMTEHCMEREVLSRGPEVYDVGFPMSKFLQSIDFCLGRNARMLSSQNAERLVHDKELPSESLYYRSVLQLVLHEHLEMQEENGRLNYAVGGIYGKSRGFVDYVRRSLSLLGLEVEVKLSDDEICAYDERCCEWRERIRRFTQYRFCMAPCVEAIVLLDRYCYLLEQDCVKEAHLVRVFDPVTSPRCYALIAVKHETTR